MVEINYSFNEWISRYSKNLRNYQILSIIHILNFKCLRSERPMFSGLAALPSSFPSYALTKSSWLPNNLEDRSSSLVNEIVLQILSLSSSYLLRYLIKDKWSPSRYCSSCYLPCVGSTHSSHCHAITLLLPFEKMRFLKTRTKFYLYFPFPRHESSH